MPGIDGLFSDLLGSPESLKAEPLASQNQKGDDGGGARKILFFLKADSHLPPLKLEQSWENGAGVPNQETCCLLSPAERA